MVIKNIKKWIIIQSKVGLSSIQNLYQFILLLLRYIWKKRIFEAAQALTLVSILSLVPIFAIFFSVLGMITNRESVRVELEAYITQFFIPKYGEIIFGYLEKFSNTALKAGSFGIITYFGIAIIFYHRIDKTINEIWNVENHRAWNEKIVSFILILVLSPVMVILSFSASSFLFNLPFNQIPYFSSLAYLTTFFIPVIFSGLLLFAVYFYFPFVYVMKRSAALGAIVSAVLMQLSYLGLNIYFLKMIGYERLYGSLAVIPIVIVWILIMWFCVLLGTVIAYLWQTYRMNEFREPKELDQYESIATSATRVYFYICSKFYEKNEWALIEEMHVHLQLSNQRLRQIVFKMKKQGYIVEFLLPKKKGMISIAYQPGISPAEVNCNQFYSDFQTNYQAKDDATMSLFVEPIHQLQNRIFEKFTYLDAIKYPQKMMKEFKKYF